MSYPLYPLKETTTKIPECSRRFKLVPEGLKKVQEQRVLEYNRRPKKAKEGTGRLKKAQEGSRGLRWLTKIPEGSSWFQRD